MFTLRFDPLEGLTGRLNSLQFSADGESLSAVVRFPGNVIRVGWWNLHDRVQTAFVPGARINEDDFTPPAPALSPDLRLLAYVENERGGVQRLVLLGRAKTKHPATMLTAWPYTPPDDHNYQQFFALTFSPDGSFLYALVQGGDPDGEPDSDPIGIYRWSIPDLLNRRGPKSSGHRLPDPNFYIRTPASDVYTWGSFGRPLVIAPDGGKVAAGIWDKTVHGWSLPNGEALPAMGVKKKRKKPFSWRLAFSPDSRWLAAADETVSMFDTTTGKLLHTLPAGPVVSHPELQGRAPFVFDLAFSTTGRLLATANGDPVVRLWDWAQEVPSTEYDWGIGGVTAVAFSPDGALAAAGGEDGQIAVWDVDG